MDELTEDITWPHGDMKFLFSFSYPFRKINVGLFVESDNLSFSVTAVMKNCNCVYK